MGNPPMDGASCGDAAAIHTFYSSASWIEGAALDQLNQVAHLPGVHQVTAFPDLHPGKYGPVGCAILADRVYPHLVGNDIGCGMSLYALDMPLRKLRIDKAAEKLRALEGPWTGDASRFLVEAGLPEIMHDDALGTIGGGNHFCELQTIQEIMDQSLANLIGISRNSTLKCTEVK